jgi:hypothetical protein
VISRLRRGRAVDAVRPSGARGRFRQSVRQLGRRGPQLHQRRHHALSAPPARNRVDRIRDHEPPGDGWRFDCRMLALRRGRPDRHLQRRALAQRRMSLG